VWLRRMIGNPLPSGRIRGIDVRGAWPVESRVYDSIEELEMRRRLPRAWAQIAALVAHIKDIRVRSNAAPLPAAMPPVDTSPLLRGLIDAVLDSAPAGVTESVARRMARKIGDHLLWRRGGTVPVVHELIILAPWWMANIPGEVFARLRDIGLEHILNGAVKPIQAVWQELLDAPLVFMGHCTCRSAHVSEDLYAQDRQVYLAVGEKEQRVLLDRFVDRFAALRQRHDGAIPDCDPAFVDVGQRLLEARRAASDEYRLGVLFERTYPFWEFLPVIEPYTPSWIRSLHANHKARLLHKELAFELATALYLGKGVLFSTMRLFDQPYCICSCPTPENGGGCVLTNWHYGSGSDASLLPSDAAHGRRRDAAGGILPCNRFPIRANRACIGCGCAHGHRDPRGMKTVLAEAEHYLRAVR